MHHKDLSIKLSVSPSEVFFQHRVVPAAMFDRTYIAVFGKCVHHAISTGEDTLILSLPFNIFRPDKKAIQAMFRSKSGSIKRLLKGWQRNPIEPTSECDVRVRYDSVDVIANDQNFIPAPLYSNVMLKVAPTRTEIAAIDEHRLLLIEVPSGLMYPKLVNCLN